jgi:single-strand DNA-binding protein
MRCMNKVQLIGYLGADPDVRSTQDGTPVAALSMATKERWKDKDSGEPREATEWHRLVLWRGLAEIAQQYLRKGDPVMVEGALETRKWQDQAGQDHWTSEIVVRDLIQPCSITRLGSCVTATRPGSVRLCRSSKRQIGTTSERLTS